MNLYTDVNLKQNEVQFAVIHPLANAPSGVEGQVYYNTTDDTLYMHDGTQWKPVGVRYEIEYGQAIDSIALNLVGSDGNTDTVYLKGAGGATLSVNGDTLTITSKDYPIGTKLQLETGTSQSESVWTPEILHDYVMDRIGEIPADQFLDLNKTEFVQNFSWSAVLYPGSTDPNLDGKPVLVLALTDGDTTAYSFLNMESLISAYTGTAPINVNGSNISLNDSGATAGSFGDANNMTPSWGESFKALFATINSKGLATLVSEHNVTIPDTVASATSKGLMSAEDKQKLDLLSPISYTQVTGKPTSDQEPDFGDTVTVSQISQASSGQVSALDRTIKIPDTLASDTNDGLMSAEDKDKLDNVDDIYNTECGDIVTIDDAQPDSDVTSLQVSLEPVQAGTPVQDDAVYNEPYLEKDSPSFNSEYDKLVGASVVANQLAEPRNTNTVNGITATNNDDGSMTLTGTATATAAVPLSLSVSAQENHTYYLGEPTGFRLYDGYAGDGFNIIKRNRAAGSMIVYAYVNSGVTVNEKIYVQCIDLTQYYGSAAIPDRAYSMEQSQAGSGIAFLKGYDFFTKDYYPYNAGTLQSVKPTAHVTSQTYPLAGTELRGLFQLVDNKIVAYGDTQEHTGLTTHKFGIVDLGTLTYSYTDTTAYKFFWASITGMKAATSGEANGVCTKYTWIGVATTTDIQNASDKIVGTYNGVIRIKDTAYTDAATFKTAMSGVYLIYELATPTTETLTGFDSPQAVGSTESYTDNRDFPVPVGHESRYANIYPISGHDSVGANVTGKNLLDDSAVSSTSMSDNDGVYTNTVTDTKTVFNFIVRTFYADSTYTSFGWTNESVGHKTLAVAPTQDVTSLQIVHNGSVRNIAIEFTGLSLKGGRTYMFSMDILGANPSVVGGLSFTNVQLETGTTATDFAPYTGSTYTATLPQTVYGGNAELVGGTGKSTMASVDLGTLNWTYDSSSYAYGFFTSSALSDRKAGALTNALCSAYTVNTGGRYSMGGSSGQIASFNETNANAVCIRDDAYTDPATFKAAMSGVQLVYELATPTDLTLTPQSITLNEGTNNVWSEQGDVCVSYIKERGELGEFIADTQRAIADTVRSIQVTLESANWSNNTQTVTVEGVDGDVIIAPDPTSLNDYVDAGIVCTAQGTDSLTFTCDTTPTTDITVNILIMR